MILAPVFDFFSQVMLEPQPAAGVIVEGAKEAGRDKRRERIEAYLRRCSPPVSRPPSSRSWHLDRNYLVFSMGTPNYEKGRLLPDVYLPADLVFPYHEQPWVIRLYFMESPEGYPRKKRGLTPAQQAREAASLCALQGIGRQRLEDQEPPKRKRVGKRSEQHTACLEVCQIVSAPAGVSEAAQALVGLWFKRIADAMTRICTAVTPAEPEATVGSKRKRAAKQKVRNDWGNAYWAGTDRVLLSRYRQVLSADGLVVQYPREACIVNPKTACINGTWCSGDEALLEACKRCVNGQAADGGSVGSNTDDRLMAQLSAAC